MGPGQGAAGGQVERELRPRRRADTGSRRRGRTSGSVRLHGGQIDAAVPSRRVLLLRGPAGSSVRSNVAARREARRRAVARREAPRLKRARR